MRIAKNHNILAIVSSMIVFTVFSGFCLTQVTIKARAVTESANASVTVGSACTLAKSVTTAHTASITNGSYYGDSGIGETLLQANCNDASGFAIYAIGYTGNESGANYLRDNTLYSTYNDTYDITTGTGTSGNSNWSMKLTAVSNSDTPVIQNSYDSYHNVPSEYALVANKASGTTIDDGARVKATYTAYISESQPAGTYEGKVKYALVHPATKPAPYVPHSINTTAGQICYYPNTNEHQGTMGCQTISASDTSAELLASNFSRTGYGFAGWSDVYDYDTNPNAHFYGPQEDIAFTAGQYTGPNPGLSLYAVWVESAGSLQTNATTICSSLTQAPTDGTANLDSVSALTDQRDNQTYAIAKLADGKCWMIENLRLEAEYSRGTHNEALAQGYNASFIGLADAETDLTASTVANSLYTIEPDIAGKKTISGNNLGARFPRYNNINTSSRTTFPRSNDDNIYSYGNYYTWHAAIADTTDYTIRTNISTSICPSGWKLPIGGQTTVDDSFGALGASLGWPTGIASLTENTTPSGQTMSRILKSFPNNFLIAGEYRSSRPFSSKNNGPYWSSSASGYDGRAEAFEIETYRVSLGGADFQSDGYSIRCIVSN